MRRFTAHFDPVRGREWLQNRVGYVAAKRLIETEARVLGIDPMSDIALKHAIATYTATTGHSPNNTSTTDQEGLLP